MGYSTCLYTLLILFGACWLNISVNIEPMAAGRKLFTQPRRLSVTITLVLGQRQNSS